MLISQNIIFFDDRLYPIILNIWLGNQYSIQIYELTKIFSLIAIYSSISHILITKFEADQNSKKNFRIELFFLPFFLIILGYLVFNMSSLILISLLILIKEIYLVLLRFIFYSSKIKKIINYLVNISTFPIILLLSFFNMYLFYVLLIILIIITIKNVKQNN